VIKAYILVRTRVGKLEEVLEKAKEIENVENISVVSGDYDIIIKVKVNDLEDLMKLTDKLHLINGIKQTVTYVIEKEISL